MRKPKTEEQLTKDLEIVIRKLNKAMQGSTQDNLTQIELKVTEICSELKRQHEKKASAQKAKEREREQKGEEKRRRIEEKRRRIEETIQMAANGINPKIIEDIMGYQNVTRIYQIMQKYNIATERTVSKLIFTEQDNEAIAKQTNWTVEAIQRLREEKAQEVTQTMDEPSETEQGKVEEENAQNDGSKSETTEQTFRRMQNNVTPKEENAPVDKPIQDKKTVDLKQTSSQGIVPRRETKTTKSFFNMAREITDIRTMAKELHMTVTEVRSELRKTGYYDREKVVELIRQGRDNEEIATKGGVTVEAVKRVREEEERKLAEQNTPQAMETTMQIQKREAAIENYKIEKYFLGLAKRFEKEDAIANALHISYYDVMLLLKKHGITSRTELERLIEADLDSSDEEIAASINGNIEAIKEVRKAVKKREKLINTVSIEKQEEVIRQLSHGSVSLGYIATKLYISNESIKAIAEKWNRDKNFNMPESIKRRNYARDINTFRAKVQSTNERCINDTTRKLWDGTIKKLLVEYEPFLTDGDYAFICYAYMKMEVYNKGIEIAKDYLELKEHTVYAVKSRIYEIVEREIAEKQKGTSSVTVSTPIREEDQR